MPVTVSLARAEMDEALLGLAERLLEAATPQEVAQCLVGAVVTSYGFPRAVVVARDAKQLAVLAQHGAVEPAPGAGCSAAVDQAHELQEAQVVPDVRPSAEPWLVRLVPAGSDLLVVPLNVRRRPVGALVLQIPMALRGATGRAMLTEVERGARYAALTLDRVQRLTEVRHQADTSESTTALRQRFLTSLEHAVAGSRQRGEPVSLVLLDLDRFAQVNAVHGRLAGDEALSSVAAALTRACGELDTVPHYSADAFAVILRGCAPQDAAVVADRLRAAVHAAPGGRRLTASAGVASSPTHARDAAQLLQAADAALVVAKRRGRDRTVMAPCPGPEQDPVAPR